MIVVFIVVSLVIAFLVFLMFVILRKTVRIVNSQTKSYFVNKLQGYDDLISEKESKLLEIDELIKNKEKGIKDNNNNKKESKIGFDTDVIDLLYATSYQDKNIFELNKKIDENFIVNYEELIKDFLTLCEDEKDYDFCVALRGKFDSDMVYELKSLMDTEMEERLKVLLDEKEYKVYEAFKLIVSEHTIDNFLDYLDQLVDLNNPKVTILTGSSSENYDHLSKYIETVYSDKIYRGIKIIYRKKVYDFSLCERNV